MNLYNPMLLTQGVASDAAQLVSGTVYDLSPQGDIGATGIRAMRLAGGNHATGIYTAFCAPSDDVADNATAEHVFYAIKKIGETKCLALALTAAITATYSANTASLPVILPDGTASTTSLRFADTLDAVTLTGLGSQLAAKYDAFTPEVLSPTGNALASILWPSLPSMWGLAVDVWGSSALTRHLLWDSHS